MTFSEPAKRLDGLLQSSANVWAYVNLHRAKNDAINHGQGYPNWESPSFVKSAGVDAINQDFNQYAPNAGSASLKTQLCQVYNHHYAKLSGIEFDLDVDNIQITNGCAGALDSCFRAFLNPGDEVLTVEPFFTFYRGQVSMCGATLVSVPLDITTTTTKTDNGTETETEWRLDVGKLARAITARTRILILNTPHNPTGYVFPKAVLLAIAAMVLRHPRLLVVTDEVYEYITYGESDTASHHYFASISREIFARTLMCTSAAKTFSITGWKVGWVIAPPALIRLVNITCRTNCWCVAAPLQEAMARILVAARRPYGGQVNYYAWLRQMYTRKRALMLTAIRDSGMTPIVPKGAYYIMVDAFEFLSQLSFERPLNMADPTSYNDWQFVKWMMEKIGVAVIPGSAFYDYNKFDAASMKKFPYIRFAYCVEDETILQTGKQLKLLSKALATATTTTAMKRAKL